MPVASNASCIAFSLGHLDYSTFATNIELCTRGHGCLTVAYIVLLDGRSDVVGLVYPDEALAPVYGLPLAYDPLCRGFGTGKVNVRVEVVDLEAVDLGSLP